MAFEPQLAGTGRLLTGVWIRSRDWKMITGDKHDCYIRGYHTYNLDSSRPASLHGSLACCHLPLHVEAQPARHLGRSSRDRVADGGQNRVNTGAWCKDRGPLAFEGQRGGESGVPLRAARTGVPVDRSEHRRADLRGVDRRVLGHVEYGHAADCLQHLRVRHGQEARLRAARRGSSAACTKFCPRTAGARR